MNIERVATAERARFDAQVAQAEAEQSRLAAEEEMYGASPCAIHCCSANSPTAYLAGEASASA